jgi:hypothetical protein
MLAKQDWFEPPCAPVSDLDYSGFPHWVALAAEPNRERRSADWLRDHLNIHVYWPHFTVQRQFRNRPRIAIARAVLPGILLAPAEITDLGEREAILEWAHLRIVKLARFITKAEVEMIRQIEAALNRYREEKKTEIKIGDRVAFRDEFKAAFLGEGSVIEVASCNRITVKLAVSLIGTDIMTVAAAELDVK